MCPSACPLLGGTTSLSTPPSMAPLATVANVVTGVRGRQSQTQPTSAEPEPHRSSGWQKAEKARRRLSQETAPQEAAAVTVPTAGSNVGVRIAKALDLVSEARGLVKEQNDYAAWAKYVKALQELTQLAKTNPHIKDLRKQTVRIFDEAEALKERMQSGAALGNSRPSIKDKLQAQDVPEVRSACEPRSIILRSQSARRHRGSSFRLESNVSDRGMRSERSASSRGKSKLPPQQRCSRSVRSRSSSRDGSTLPLRLAPRVEATRSRIRLRPRQP